MFVLRTMSQNFKYVTKYLQLVGRILKTNSLDITKKFILSCLFIHNTKKNCRLFNIG